MGINLQIQNFKENISKVINESGLPISVVDMVLGEFKKQTQMLTIQAIQNEKLTEEGEIKDGIRETNMEQ